MSSLAPRATQVAVAALAVATAVVAVRFGWAAGAALAVFTLTVAAGPWAVRTRQLTAAAYYRADPVIGADRWEAYRAARFRRLLDLLDLELSYRDTHARPARHRRYVRVSVRLCWWPGVRDVRAVTVKLPPRAAWEEVGDRLHARMAAFLGVEPERARAVVRRRLRTRVTFSRLGAYEVAEAERDYVRVAERDTA